MISVVSKNKSTEIFELLLNYGADFNAQDLEGNSIFHIAVRQKNFKILCYIFKNLKNFNFDARNIQGLSGF